MKILAEYNGKKCYIVNAFIDGEYSYCAIILDGEIRIVDHKTIKVVDENYKV